MKLNKIAASIGAVSLLGASMNVVAAENTAPTQTVDFYGYLSQVVINKPDDSVDSARATNSIGVKINENMGDGVSAFAKVEMGINGETATGTDQREMYVGVDLGTVAIQTGKMKTLEKEFVSGNVNILDYYSLSTSNDARVANQTRVTADLGEVIVGAQVTTDGASGKKGADEYEIGMKTTLGSVTVGAIYNKDAVNDTDRTAFSAKTSLTENLSLRITHEPEEKKTNVLTMTSFGSNYLLAGYRYDEDGDNRATAELHHKMSKKVRVFAGVAKTGSSDPAVLAGMAISF
jgi:predicted porin